MAISAVSQLPLEDLLNNPYFMTSTPNLGGYTSNKISYLAIKNDILKNVTTKSLTVSATEGGTVEPAGTFTMLENGDVLTVPLSATEIPGYKFSGWTGDASGTTNPQPVVFDRTKSVTANFTPNKTVHAKKKVKINASYVPGYSGPDQFSGWAHVIYGQNKLAGTAYYTIETGNNTTLTVDCDYPSGSKLSAVAVNTQPEHTVHTASL